jgi:DNA invertase Pin-like site-specific DNA recombinase
MKGGDLPPAVVERRAVVYVRQSTGVQVQENLESQRRQYELADLARSHGFREVVVIDDDLGRSASGTVLRPGFESLVAQLCQGVVGAVFCLEASRLARNGREWHHLLEMCGLVGARVIDSEGIYDPSHPNDRLLLGLKGTMSEFELTLLRRRLVEGAVAKARRGELRIGVPVGYIWSRDTGLEVDPDRRVQEAIRTVFGLFDQLGSAHQVMIKMAREGLLVPRPSDPKRASPLRWSPPSYRNVISVLTNPFYAGAYAYGKSSHRTHLVGGRLSRTYGHDRPMDQWTVLLRDHHDGYISWEKYERNQEQLRRNSFSKPAGEAKSGRGGRALLSGLLRCRRCGRMLQVLYSGRGAGVARYHCRRGHGQFGAEPCIFFSARRPDEAVAREVLAVVQPLAIEAAVKAEEQARQAVDERRRAMDLERQQAEYEVRLARRRYESVDPDNRLVASELEARWNAALQRLRECEARIAEIAAASAAPPSIAELSNVAQDLRTAWDAPTTTMAMKQRLIRSLIREVVVDVDDERREVILVIHWRGGQHSEVRVRKPSTGEHNKRAPAKADAIIRDMATKWDDQHIAATLNRMGLKTGQGMTWNEKRVGSYRRTAGIVGYASAVKDGRCLTMYEAARAVGATSHAIRRLIQRGILPARQVVMDAPWQIMASDLQRPEVQEALCRRRVRGGRPCRDSSDDRTLKIPGT